MEIRKATRTGIENYVRNLGASFCATSVDDGILVGHIEYKGSESPLVAFYLDQPDYLAYTNAEKMVELLKRVTD